ncbi:hypothetical protein GCM10010329_06670 [Streptomyces spiroverticillatus]|uniref:PE-PGRS family protein n=1 Tax=Streptomyces finlayi TaxID=67296 RepID=A0A919C7Y8_9ACTN|nr:hypothetical protein [Streptomyces finlayi]GGZ89017.1 hypothetical protein GCM10010329_06670 [Streptomyces spiroverticillatus]GHC79942.1 hypothetical protein GCM10010334_06650 [Streptomyces finlayi]
MADFRRPPEWDQHADRHTPLIDPVITVRQLSRFEFRKPLTRIDHALVFSTPKGAYDTYLPPVRPTRAEAATKRYSSVYEVDMGVHPVQAELALPSDNDAFEFGCIVELSWQVVDPARFVASGYRDVPRLLLGELEQAARPVARLHAIADSAVAEQELLRAVTALGALGGGVGLKVAWTVRLRRDQENIDHQKRLQSLQHNAAEQVLDAQLGMTVDSEVARRLTQQDALALQRATAYGEQNHVLALQQQQWAHQQALLAGQQALELQRLEAEKINFYQYHLAQGGVHAWALHLAQHPEDSALVMNSMREDQLRMIQAQMDLVGQLLAGDVAQDYELDGPKQLALRTMSDILNQRLPGVTQSPAPQLPPQPGQAPQPGQHPAGPTAAPGVPPGIEPGAAPGAGSATGFGAGPAGSPATGPAAGPGTPPAPGPGGAAGRPAAPPQDAAPGAVHYATPFSPVPAPSPAAGPALPGQQPHTPDAPGQETVPPAGPPAWTAAPYGAGPTPPWPGAQPTGAPPHAPNGTPAGTPSAPPAWQPPPGYGSAPTMPQRPEAPAPDPDPQNDPSTAAPHTEDTAPRDTTTPGTGTP